MKRIGILGFGNMGKCIAQGLMLQGEISGENIFVYRRNQEKLKMDAASMKVHACTSYRELVMQSDLVVLSVNPTQMDSVLREIEPYNKGKIFVSIMASKTLKDFDAVLKNPDDFHVVISIPNTPIKVCEGILVTSKNHRLTEQEYQTFIDMFSPISMIYPVEDDMLSVAETIAGCSPAFVFMMIQAISDSATAYGIPREENYPLIAKMVLGSAKLMLETNKHPALLKEEVASPKGTTIKGIIALDRDGFSNAVHDAYESIFHKD